MEKLGKKIRRLRKEADKCQKELLDNQSAVAQIENGSNLNPKRARIKEIAINLGTTIEELVKDTDWIETNVVKSSSIAVSESDFELKVFNKNRFEHRLDGNYWYLAAIVVWGSAPAQFFT